MTKVEVRKMHCRCIKNIYKYQGLHPLPGGAAAFTDSKLYKRGGYLCCIIKQDAVQPSNNSQKNLYS
jgi:hypothetical protein